MISSVQTNNYSHSFLHCYVCLQTVQKPKMCPYCSKLACFTCLQTWIEQTKSECPHCRRPILLSSFADCERFINDIKHLLSSAGGGCGKKQKCEQHKIQLIYYCEDCSSAICSDCGMFGSHRSHKIIHLSKIYQESKGRILKQLTKLDNKIWSLRKVEERLKQSLQAISFQAAQKKTYFKDQMNLVLDQLEEEYDHKRGLLVIQSSQNQQQIDFLESFRDDLCHELQSKTQKELINRSEDFLSSIQGLGDKQSQFTPPPTPLQTMQQFLPEYQQFSYILRNYSEISEAVIYSDFYIIRDLQWRLKIYPKGNGVAKGTHLSVFLELSKGAGSKHQYQYKIELKNHLIPQNNITRKYCSTFSIGECWGYNQFALTTDLFNGFFDQDGNLHFQASVRTPNYRLLVKDQQRYIKNLENQLNLNEVQRKNEFNQYQCIDLQKQQSLKDERKQIESEFQPCLEGRKRVFRGENSYNRDNSNI